jgi:tripeptide aminopeptidase
VVNQQRLAQTFKKLVEIDSVSRHEAELCAELKSTLERLGAQTAVDDAAKKVGGDCGNLVARFSGDIDLPPMLLNAHMDTVEPGKGVKAVFNQGRFTSAGDTILGADDKSAIAIILEFLSIIKENNISHGPIEVLFTVCEEIGLLGAKNFDFNLISSRFGYTLDATDTEGIITRAPSANRIEFTVHGKDAHAGAAPEKGINAIAIAGRAIAQLQLGRIDDETTCNIGVIEGGHAANIIPSLITVKGEARSHSEKKLERVTKTMTAAFHETVAEARKASIDPDLPRLELKIERDFPRTNIEEDDPVVTLARQAAANLNRELLSKSTGGGADANIFFEKGISIGVIGTGMRDMHTVRENVALTDMIRMVELLLEINNLR